MDLWTLGGSAHAHAARALQGPSWQAKGSTMQILSCRGGPAWVLSVCEHQEPYNTDAAVRAIRGQQGSNLHLQAWGMISTEAFKGCDAHVSGAAHQ